jgi:hypothetical protein
MKITRPPHRHVPWDTADRLPRRSCGASHPHVGGRELDISPSLLPAACVRSGGNVLTGNPALSGDHILSGNRAGKHS